MLRTLNDLLGYDIQATDGEIGSVEDFLFDDRAWTIRYLVIDTGPWLFGREVLISPQSIGKPSWEGGVLPVNLTQEQVENSPEVDLVEPVSRREQEALHAHYGWQNYWTTLPTTALYGTAGLASPGAPIAAEDMPERAEPPGEPNLRSVAEVIGYDIQALDGEIGHVDDFIVDDETWAIRYMVANTGNWLPGRNVLIALPWIKDISWELTEVQVDLLKENIKNSPPFDPAESISLDYESRLHEHYDLPYYWGPH